MRVLETVESGLGHAYMKTNKGSWLAGCRMRGTVSLLRCFLFSCLFLVSSSKGHVSFLCFVHEYVH